MNDAATSGIRFPRLPYGSASAYPPGGEPLPPDLVDGELHVSTRDGTARLEIEAGRVAYRGTSPALKRLAGITVVALQRRAAALGWNIRGVVNRSRTPRPTP